MDGHGTLLELDELTPAWKATAGQKLFFIESSGNEIWDGDGEKVCMAPSHLGFPSAEYKFRHFNWTVYTAVALNL